MKKIAPKKSSAVKKSKPKQEVVHDVGRPKEIPSGELVNVVADTIERMYEEMGGSINRASAEDYAIYTVRYIKHGHWEGGEVDRLRLREVSMDAPLCAACEDA
jgi:hypothetical protein